MSVSLEKTPQAKRPAQYEKLEFVAVNLRWGIRNTFGHDFDLDLSCFLLDKNGLVKAEEDFVFYNNPASSCGSVIYLGDNRIGESHDIDAETVNIDLPKLGPDAERLVVAVTIHEADKRNQVFGFVSDARAEVINRKNNKLLAAYNLAEAFREETAMVVCEFYRYGDVWKFRSVDSPNMESLAAIAKKFGVAVD